MFLDRQSKLWTFSNRRREEICFGPWTVCMRGMDLELCTRDGCKNWPTKELVPPNKFSSWVSWSVKQRLVLQTVEEKRFVSALGLSACAEWILNFVQGTGFKNWPTKELVPPNKFSSWVSWSVKQRLVLQIREEKKFVSALGLTACVEWILNFVQETGARTDLQRSWFHPTSSLPEFLDLWNKD